MNSFIIRREYFGGLIIDNKNLKYYKVNSKVLEVIKELYSSNLSIVKNKYKEYKQEFQELIEFFEGIKLVNKEGKLNQIRFVNENRLENTLSTPLKIFIEITNMCNLQCKHCFNLSGKSMTKELSINQLKKLAKDIYDLGVPIVKISGGEPFLRKDIFEFLDLLEKYNINFIIHTNGILIDEDKIKKLKKYKYLKSIRVSIDGNKEINDLIRGENTYQNALNALKILKKNFIPCGVNFTLNKINYTIVYEMLKDIVLTYNVDVNIGTCKISGRAVKNKDCLEYKNNLEFNESLIYVHKQISKFKSKYKNNTIENPVTNELEFDSVLFSDKFGCPAANISCTIKANGDIYPCGLFFGNKVFYSGNILDTCIKDIWQQGKGMKLLRNVKKNEKCAECKYLFKKCTGGCMANAFNFSGKLSSLDPHCRKTSYEYLGY